MLMFGLCAAFYDEAWEAGANNLYPLIYILTDHVWADLVDQVPYSILLPHAYAQTYNSAAFVTTWNVTGERVGSNSNCADVSFNIDVTAGGQATIDWGDGGSPSTYDESGQVSHFYCHDSDSATDKSAAIIISGDLEHFYFHYIDPVRTNNSPQLLLSIDQWGDTQWSSMNYMFKGAVNMRYEADDTPDLSAQPSVHNMFSNARSFNGDLSDWDVSEMTSLRYMFNQAYSFNGDISDWDVSKVTDMTYMFSDAYDFNGDISDWDVSKVTDMTQMFQSARAFNGDISRWDVSSVTGMYGMFTGAPSFNSDISDWDVSSVTRMGRMFDYATSFNSNISNWDVSSVISMDDMFSNAPSFNHNQRSWFINLNDTSIGNGETLVADIYASVGFDTDINNYSITGTDADAFTIRHGQLFLKSPSNYSSKSGYSITITANTTSVGYLSLNVDPSRSIYVNVKSTAEAPTIASITRHNPTTETTNSQTLVYKVKFNKAVTNVNLSDFTLSSSSTGGVGPFTQTNSDLIEIPSYLPITDTISMSSPKTVSSVSVAVDITHPYVGNLIVDLIAPDGTTRTLQSSSSNPEEEIYQTYTPNFRGTDISGNWTLHIRDHDPNSHNGGALRNWTLTIYSNNANSDNNSITSISGSGSQYFVTVSASGDGTYNLDLVPNSGIKDTGNHLLTNTIPTGADQTYTVNTALDNTAPTLTSIERYYPTAATTDSQTLVYEVAFSESVTGVTASDFVLSSGSTGRVSGTTQVTGISGSGDTYHVTVSSTTDGTYNLDLVSSGHNIEDAADNPLTNRSPTGADQTYTVSTAVIDNTNPRLASIERYIPASQNTNSQSLIYKATFSEDVTGVTASDFTLSPSSTGGGGTSTTTASTGQFTQTRSHNLAILNLQTASDTITVSDSGTATSISVAVDITHTYIQDLKIDLVAPDGTTETLRGHIGGGADDINMTYTPSFGSVPISGVWTLQIYDRDAPDPGVLNSWTLTINYGDTATTTTASPVTGISGSGDTYYVTVSSSTDGTYNLDLVSSGHNIEDAADNPLTNRSPTGADETYTVSTAVTDNTNPRLASIERYSPASQNTDSQSLVYEVTFSEDVTGVTASDFTLSHSSTGGGGATTTTGQFTQTRSPNLAIPYDNVVSDTVTVSDSGTATSVSVAVDITHTYIQDLKIDLVAPDGTTKTLHDNSGGSANNINQTYTPPFGSVAISGAWTLKMHDNYAEDSGVLKSWTLTINYGDTTTTTVSPVTSISGSGDTYRITVSPSTDGTYNLDLVSSGHSIVDAANNPLTNTSPTGADETYTVSTAVIDNTNPRLASIERYSPASQNTNSQSLIYKATFSEDVTGVTASDFTLSHSSTGGGGATTTTGQFTQTRSPNLAIPYDNVVSDTVTVSDSGTATSVSVAVDITHTYIQDLKIDLVAPDGTTKTLHDNSGGSANNINQTYTPPFGSVAISGAWTLKMHDNYAEDSGDLKSWTLTINYGDTTTTTVSPVTSISGSGDTYRITVSPSTDGTYNLDLVSSGHSIVDAANNPLTNTSPTGADETYTVSTAVIDNTNPRLASIERYIPASQNTNSQSLIYKATFSEDVTGVTASDFTLSPSSTGGGGTSTTTASTGQFTQTRSPNLAIPYDNVVSDTVTVSDSGTATSVSVAVDITHTYIQDLKIDLVAPDGTTKTLHDNSGGSANNINQTYTPPFGSVAISGAWTLKMHDNYAEDSGVLKSWTLTINYGDTATTTTVSPVTSISGSGGTYYVTVSSSTDGTYNLDLVSSGHNIEDAADNPLTNRSPTGADETYTVSTAVIDNTNPRLASIERYSPASQNTNSQSLIYKATFSEDVTGVTASDFTLSHSSTGGGGATTTTGQFTQTRSPNLAIPYDNVVSDTVTVSDSGTATSVSVAVDITHTYIQDLKIDLVAPDGTTKTLHDNSGGSANNINQTYTPPFGSVAISGAWTLKMHDNYAEDSGDLKSWTLTINYGDTATTTTVSPVTSISGSGGTYYVTVSSSTDGTYNLDLVSSGHNIEDAADNPLTNRSPTGADETYTVSTAVIDNTNPRLASIERYSPASQNTNSPSLVYEVTFSEDVTGVTASDFTLSHSSTGGGGATTTTGQFTQTRSPNLAIPYDNVVSDTVTVSDSGTATSVSVAVDITHTYIQDLKIDLVAPDGTTKTLHDNSGGSANNINQTYTPPFGSVAISGAWTLKMHDNYAEDSGDLKSWTLTINYGDTTTTTVSPVTSISGSGDTYRITVSPSTDGTYNLDLVSSGHSIVDAANNPLTNTSPTGADETYTVSTAVIDNTNPRLASIERYSPASQNTNSQSLIYEVTFSEDVTGVTASDFVLSSGSTGSGNNGNSPVTSISGSGDTYRITVFPSTDGTYNLDLVSSGHSIVDAANNPLTNTSPTGADETYTVSTAVIDNTNPRLASIERYSPASQNTNSQSLIYEVTFSEDVTGVTASDFVLSSGSTGSGNNGNSPVTSISGSGDTYRITVFPSTDGTYNLDLVSSGHSIVDAANNPLTNTSPTGADETYTVSTAVTDTTNPRLASIERYSPASQNTNSQSLIYEVTFSEDVTGVTASDFVLSSGSTGSGNNGNSPVTSISGSGDTYRITVFPSTDGTYNLDLVSSGHNIEDAADNPLTNRSPTGADETYTVSTAVIDNTNPRLASIERYIPASQNTNHQLLDYKVTFSKNVMGVTESDFTLSPGSTGGRDDGTSSVIGVSGSGDTYRVTVLSSTDGTYNLDLVLSGHNIVDTANNPLTNTATTGADQTYTVSTTVVDSPNPTLESIERYNPASQDTNWKYLTYKVTFSKSVTGVDKSDFVLSPGSTGGGDNGKSPIATITSPGDGVYYVIVHSTVDGTYNLDLVLSGHNIADAADNQLINTVPTTGIDQTYTKI